MDIAINTPPGATRPYRRAGASAPSDDLAQNWTAQRCLRLLRPVHVSLNKLRQIKVEAAFTRQELQGPTKPVRRKRNSANEDDEAYDPLKPKRPRVTYSQRKRQMAAAASSSSSAAGKPKATFKLPSAVARAAPKTPGKLFMSTPIVRRIRGMAREAGVVSDLPRMPSLCRSESEESTKATQEPTRRPRGRPPGSTQQPPQAPAKGKSDLQLERERQLDALLKALDTLLLRTVATTPTTAATMTTGQPGPSSHPRSFIAMCLRRVPEQLKRIEEWDADEAERLGEKSRLEAQDATQDMYNQLEGFGAMATGWRPLRHLVRAHAVSALRDAIAESLLDLAAAKRLVAVCSRRGCVDEAAALLVAVLEQHHPPATRRQEVPAPQPRLLEPLELLVSFCKRHALWPTLFGTLARFLRENRLSGEWLCIRALEPVWGGLSEKLVARGEACTQTLEFFYEAVSSLVDSLSVGSRGSGSGSGGGGGRNHADDDDDEDDDARGKSLRSPAQMFTSTVGAVTAMAIMSTFIGDDFTTTTTTGVGVKGTEVEANTTTAGTGTSMGTIKVGKANSIFRAALCALSGSLAKLQERRRVRTTDSQLILKFSIYMATAAAASDRQRHRGGKAWIEAPRNSFADAANKKFYEGAVSLICSVAQHCARGGGAAGLAAHEHLVALCEPLAGLTLARHHGVEDLRREAAFLLAKRTGDLRDLAYAEASISAVKTPVSLSSSSSSSSSRQREKRGPSSPGAVARPPASGANKADSSLYSGWRWDEGISEWILRTPLPAGQSARMGARASTRSRQASQSPEEPAAVMEPRRNRGITREVPTTMASTATVKGAGKTTVVMMSAPRATTITTTAATKTKAVNVPPPPPPPPEMDSSDDEISMMSITMTPPSSASRSDWGRGRSPLAVKRNVQLGRRTAGARGVGDKVRRKTVRKISSWVQCGSSDDELLF